VSKNSS